MQGIMKWYLFDVESGNIFDEPTSITEIIRSTTDTSRSLSMARTSPY